MLMLVSYGESQATGMNWLLALVLGFGGAAFVPDTVEDFESGAVELFSFPGEDVEPDSWHIDSIQTNNNSRYALCLSGNTWKIEPIAPVALDTGDVWTVAVYVEDVAEIQGFGLVGAGETLFYSFAGTEQVDPARWVTVYQGAFGLRVWNVYDLPVGEDWLSRFGHLTTVSGIFFVNDKDSTQVGAVYFDDILNISADLPVAPLVDIWYEQEDKRVNRDGGYSITVHFYSRVFDPDSKWHSYRWSFGDDSVSSDSWPVHTYVVRDDHRFTVLLEVGDSTGRVGRDSTWIQVETGPTSFPIRLNFVGDVMLARRYELPGGIIDSLGPEGVFAQIKPYLGDRAEITVANLECPLTNRGTPHPTKPIVFRGRPSNVSGLAYAGIDVVSLANNHTIDYGLEGLRQTQAVLDSAGIKYSGAGADCYEAFLPVFRLKSGINFGFLAYSDRTGQYDNYQPYLNAGYNKPGFAEQDTWRIFQAIARAKMVSDRVVVQLHSGEEYYERPLDRADDEWFFPWLDKPSVNQREIRRRIIDNGADLIVCHHPHILQGVEVYNQKLIVHSLGNFAFDQEYPETYPSVILNGWLDRRGFYRFFLVPVYIDDYIPKRAKAELGVYILRHLARLSKELGSYVVVDRTNAEAEVLLDTLNLLRQTRQFQVPAELEPDSGWLMSAPLRLLNWGDIFKVNSIRPAGAWQFRLGRELVWFGNMEDEGATMWLLNQADEFYDTIAWRGQRSLCQRRVPGNGVLITNLEERMVVPQDSGEMGIYAMVKAENGRSVNLILNCYNSRAGGMVIKACSLEAPRHGTFNWGSVYNSFSPPANGLFFDLWLKSAAADSGISRVWFDDAAVIKWGNWQTFNSPVETISPNEFTWIQIRTQMPVNQAEVWYEELGYQTQTGIKNFRVISAIQPGLSISPIPARKNVLIEYYLPKPGKVNLKVFNSAGQLVMGLVAQHKGAGKQIVRWNLRDSNGRRVSAGSYFFCLETAEGFSVIKAVLVNTD